MEPEGGDVLRDAVWEKEGVLSREALVERNQEYLNHLELKLRELGFSVMAPMFSPPNAKTFTFTKKLKERYPHKDYETDISVCMPLAAYAGTVTCRVYDIVPINTPRPGNNRMDECLAGHTEFITTFSLDLCRATLQEDVDEFVRILTETIEARKEMSHYHHFLGNTLDPKAFGLMKNAITRD